MTDFLFARPSFLEGLARILDIGGTMQKYNESQTPEEADAKAMYNDFKTVGDDISFAFDQYEKSQQHG
jgi:hypothetical protein